MCPNSLVTINFRNTVFNYVDALCPKQQFYCHVRTILCLPGLNQYLAAMKCLAQKHNTMTLVNLELAKLINRAPDKRG